MGIYIPKMEMPTSCWDCPCINGENGYCELRKEYVYGEIPRSCPLVPVPPHGRLIDADALNELIDSGDDIDFSEVPETKYAIMQMVREQETIIEREKEDG